MPFSLDSRSLAQVRQNRIQGIDPYGPILKRQRFRLWPEVEKKKNNKSTRPAVSGHPSQTLALALDILLENQEFH